MMKYGLWLLVLLPWLPLHAAYKIVIVTSPAKSHYVMNFQLARSLVARGHDVTIVMSLSMSLPAELVDPRVTIKYYPSSLSPIELQPDFQDAIVQNRFNRTLLTKINYMGLALRLSRVDIDSMITNRQLLDDLKAQNFDFAVVSPPLLYGSTYVPYYLEVPFAYLLQECLGAQMTLPSTPVHYIPHMSLVVDSHRMTLAEKLENIAMSVLSHVLTSLSSTDEGSQNIVPHRPPVTVAQLNRNASLCLRLKEPVLDLPRPNLPNVIDVGTMLVRRAAPLPVNLQQFLDDAPRGVILVSFGSLVDKLPAEFFAELRAGLEATEYHVMWKLRGADVTSYSDKFLIQDWLPQVDVLNHTNLKAFVSHCGFSSMMESMYYGVPMVCIPFMADQDVNANLLRIKRLAKVIDAPTMTSNILSSAISDVTSDTTLENVKRVSRILQEVPNGGDTAAFWVEHVIKHGDGHLRSAMLDMSVWEYYMGDVISVVLVAVILEVLLVHCLCKLACRRCHCRCSTCCGRRNKIATKLD